MLRKASSFCLLASLLGIAGLTLKHIDPPFTDLLLFSFIKSDVYLPAGDSVKRKELYAPVAKLLAADRKAYKVIFWLSGIALLSSIALFISSTVGRHTTSTSGLPADPGRDDSIRKHQPGASL